MSTTRNKRRTIAVAATGTVVAAGIIAGVFYQQGDDTGSGQAKKADLPVSTSAPRHTPAPTTSLTPDTVPTAAPTPKIDITAGEEGSLTAIRQLRPGMTDKQVKTVTKGCGAGTTEAHEGGEVRHNYTCNDGLKLYVHMKDGKVTGYGGTR
ncbi:hypothetical protein [Streptomyces sp. NPDC048442]|uniref:hypothetical protein n=1 Tax=Streptomyces sp. NPDC048442 TaxID=3154823 RepID=UPI0034482BC6